MNTQRALEARRKAISPCFIIPIQSPTYANPAYPHSPASDIWPTQIHTPPHTHHTHTRAHTHKNTQTAEGILITI